MTDDAVAPVIAAMLILAVVVTFFAAWNAYYVPSMKAQSEINHIKDVETGFLQFSSDIDTAASMKRDMRLSEAILLGGGDFTFDPVKSGGELTIRNALPGKFLRLNWTNETDRSDSDYYCSLVDVSYEPVNNFWQDQGYRWVNGTVYVKNAERNLSTPLLFSDEQNITYGLAGSLIDLEYAPAYSSPGNCSSMTVRVVNITPDSRHFRASGNGNAMLVLESTEMPPERVINATSLNISISTKFPEQFRTGLWNSMNSSIDDALASCGNIQRTKQTETEVQLTFRTYPHPNLTLIRETTEITIGAY
ncbi:MAG: hypothetical protein WCX22_09160 [Methanoregula sp.]